MNTLGTPPATRMNKHESHKLHHEFEVGSRAQVATYSADFVTSNVIAFSVDGVAITPVTFATSHALTFAALVTAIDGLSSVESATGDAVTRVITIIPIDQEEGGSTVTTAVTLGASQATGTVVYDSNTIYIGTPVQMKADGTIIPAEGIANLDYIGVSIKEAGPGEFCTIMCAGFCIITCKATGSVNPGPVKFTATEDATGYNVVSQSAVTAANRYGFALSAVLTGEFVRVLVTL